MCNEKVIEEIYTGPTLGNHGNIGIQNTKHISVGTLGCRTIGTNEGVGLMRCRTNRGVGLMRCRTNGVVGLMGSPLFDCAYV